MRKPYIIVMLHENPGKELSITEDGESILTFSYGSTEKPPHFHPLYTPNGHVVTEGEQTQRQRPPGICFILGNVNDEELDRETSTSERMSSAAETSEAFTVVTTWNAPEKPLLIETLTTEVHPRQTEAQVLDIAVSLHAPSNSLAFAGNIGLAYYAIEMEHRRAMNADGRIGESEVSENVSLWGTLCGITATEQEGVGVAIFPHPENGETTFFAEDAAFGFLFAQAAPFTVDAGATRTLRYRVLAYIGDLFTVDVWQYHQDYVG